MLVEQLLKTQEPFLSPQERLVTRQQIDSVGRTYIHSHAIKDCVDDAVLLLNGKCVLFESNKSLFESAG